VHSADRDRATLTLTIGDGVQACDFTFGWSRTARRMRRTRPTRRCVAAQSARWVLRKPHRGTAGRRAGRSW